MNTITLESTISKRAELLSSEVDGEIVMMNIETGRYIGMNSVGSEIWKMIDTGASSVEDICIRLKQVFKVDDSTCQRGVLDFCSNLLKENLILLD